MSDNTATSAASSALHICFVCSGNICRSPMAELIFAHAIDEAGLSEQVRVTSAGTGRWHIGEPADNRARTELLAHGYSDQHVAAQLSPDHLSADLIVVADRGHVADLERKRLGNRVRLLRSFDPDAADADLPDPYYGTPDDFSEVREQIEAAIPGLLAWTHATLADRS
ncbi:low molecular weight protein-tyrosine-phosphatase [Gordonia malaquae]|uniref:low molecular weight protein-tyrosine-phosphatase n=1 Tax=Gordonia malaquae TaxID=410332 RepID=UPI0030C7911B